ncbi:TPA: hypothetical protein QCX51_000335 [Bacillus mycoides]|nr:hypothetical protein [Bacillus mycoides]
MSSMIRNFYWKMYEKKWSVLSTISPELATKMHFKRVFKRPLDLKNPITFNEKLQWLKLNTYYNNPLITQCADKYAVREYISKRGCSEILNDLIGVYDSFNEIDWDKLPERFALKVNHGCGYNLICTDKKKLSYKEVKNTVDKWMESDYWKRRAEVNYKYISPKIIIENYIETDEGVLPEDYKFYCFDGKVPYVMLCVGRESGHAKYYIFDRDWKVMPFSQDALNISKDKLPKKPDGIDELFEYAEKLSEGFPFVRTDLYLINGKVIFGELTFTPGGALDTDLQQGDIVMGEMIDLKEL